MKSVDELVKRVEQLQNGYVAAKVQADLRQVEAPKKIGQATRSAFRDHIDILVNNAGCTSVKGLGDISVDDFSYVYDLNVRAVLLMSKEVLPYLRKPRRNHQRKFCWRSLGSQRALSVLFLKGRRRRNNKMLCRRIRLPRPHCQRSQPRASTDRCS